MPVPRAEFYGRPAGEPARVEPRFDRRSRTLEVLGEWGGTARLDEALAGLAAFLGAERVVRR